MTLDQSFRQPLRELEACSKTIGFQELPGLFPGLSGEVLLVTANDARSGPGRDAVAQIEIGFVDPRHSCR